MILWIFYETSDSLKAERSEKNEADTLGYLPHLYFIQIIFL